MANSFALGLTVSILAYAPSVWASAHRARRFWRFWPRQRPAPPPAAATITWLMMIVGIAVTAGVSGQFLDPYTPERLMNVVASWSPPLPSLRPASPSGASSARRRPPPSAKVPRSSKA
jgi:hypothetical protein